MPNLRIQNFGGSLKVLYVDNTDLVRDKRSTYLTEDIVVGGSTLAVQSIIGFESLDTSSGQVLVIGKIGDERTEVRRTSNTTGQSPSAAYKWIYLRDTLQFDHPQDEVIQIIDWDRIEFNYAASVSGTKTTLSAYPVGITPDNPETLFRDTTESANRLTGAPTTAFYFTRFNNTIDSRNSAWSDNLYGTGFDDNAVGAIKENAVKDLGEKIDGNIITHEYLDESLWEARRDYHNAPGKRPFRRKFNFVIGRALTGSFRIELPTDVERPWTAENVYGVRVGTNENMDYIDKKEWDFYYEDKPHSTLDVPYVLNTSTSIWLANGRDFSASATINVEGTTIGLSRITGSENSFTIITHGDWAASGGSDAWENISLGLPDKFTVFADPEGSAYVYFNQPFDTAYVNQNIVLDYYRTLVSKDSDNDILDEPKYDMFKDYLKAKIKHRKTRGEGDITQDPDFKLWIFKRGESLATEFTGSEIRISPDVSHLPLPE